jgi:5-(carboxyamino)imidazole ribonucleotide synthase
MAALPPGSTIGILGGGQLGRMLAEAASRLGLKTHIFAPETDSPAFDVATVCTVAAYGDGAALAAFASAVQAITFEFENVPSETVAFLGRTVPVRPGPEALACAQDRFSEKTLARELGAMTAEFARVDSLGDLEKLLDDGFPIPCVLKTRSLGYDGKGQTKISTRSDVEAAWAAMGDVPSLLESFVAFDCEISVIAARTEDGSFRAFEVTENEHRNHILNRSVAPARISARAREEAIDIAHKIAQRLGYVGVFAIEFFALDKAGETQLFVNEMAPRVHNSGHWTQDGCETSQFEQHIRAVAGWPLGSTEMTAPAAEMINLIGDDVLAWPAIVAEPGAHLHHYGKREIRPGRKMGHVNRRLFKVPE